ncbi:MAG: AMP-binding protein [Pseudomonadota bacterium]|jgi:fatty-acyl-CoA synthase
MSFDLFDITAKRAELAPDRPAMEDLVTGRVLSYAALEDCASRSAALLAAHGVAQGERVALLCRNRIEFFELLFACAKLGALLVPLNWRMPARELAGLMADCAPRLLLYGKEDAQVAQALIGPACPGLALDEAGPEGFVAAREACSPHPGRMRWPGDEAWYLLYTSGTTGAPKAVIQTYGMALANYVNIGQAIALRGSDVTLNFLPLFHTAGINLHSLPTLIAGGQVLVLPGFDVERMIDLLSAGRLDIFFAVPAVYQQLSLHPRFDRVDLGGLRSWACGGAPLPDSLIKTYAARGVQVCNGYGMTETGPTAFLVDEAAAAVKIASVGKPQLLTKARIVDNMGADVPPDTPGEIWLSGPGITPGYWRQQEATAQAFAPGGWLKTGDLGRMDKDGYYYIVGRIKDMYISGGENVYPAEVENVLARHPAILEAAVVGIADARWGEVGRAFVMPRPGAAMPDAAALDAYCREHLAPYKVPKSFVTVADFPRTAAGKIQKHLIPHLKNQA